MGGTGWLEYRLRKNGIEMSLFVAQFAVVPLCHAGDTGKSIIGQVGKCDPCHLRVSQVFLLCNPWDGENPSDARRFARLDNRNPPSRCRFDLGFAFQLAMVFDQSNKQFAPVVGKTRHPPPRKSERVKFYAYPCLAEPKRGAWEKTARITRR